jgi:hypothetical protein
VVEDFLPDKNKDVIEERVEEYFSELKRRGIRSAYEQTDQRSDLSASPSSEASEVGREDRG